MDHIPLEPTRGEFSIRNKKGRALTSKIVIPIAYISVSLEGSCFTSSPVNPNFSRSNNSGAIHRVVPFIRPSTTVGLLVISSTIAASPKSAKRARHSESIRMLTLRDHSVSSPIVQYIKTHSLEVSVDNTAFMQVFQPGHRTYELSKRSM